MPFTALSRSLLDNAAASRLAHAGFGNFIVDPQPVPVPPSPPREAPIPNPTDKPGSLITALQDVKPGDLITSGFINRLIEALREVGGRLAEVEAGKNALVAVLREADVRLDALEARSVQPPAPPPQPLQPLPLGPMTVLAVQPSVLTPALATGTPLGATGTVVP